MNEFSGAIEVSLLDSNRIMEIYRQIRLVGNKIWPNFGDLIPQFVLVGERFQWAFNVSSLPDYYIKSPVPDSLKDYCSSFAYAPVYYDADDNKHAAPPAFLGTAYPPNQTKPHFREPVFFINTLENSKKAGFQWSSEDWVSISCHELFHCFQHGFIGIHDDYYRNRLNYALIEKINLDVEHKEPARSRIFLTSRCT